jgi:hypothetical protein
MIIVLYLKYFSFFILSHHILSHQCTFSLISELIRDNSFSYCVIFCNYHDRFRIISHSHHFSIIRARNRSSSFVFSNASRARETWEIDLNETWTSTQRWTESTSELSRNISSHKQSYQTSAFSCSIFHRRRRKRNFTEHRFIVSKTSKTHFKHHYHTSILWHFQEQYRKQEMKKLKTHLQDTSRKRLLLDSSW